MQFHMYLVIKANIIYFIHLLDKLFFTDTIVNEYVCLMDNK